MDVSIAKAIHEGSEKLRAAGVSQARLEASLLLSHALGCDRAALLAHDDQALSDRQSQTFAAFVSRRAAGEPLQYITGHQAFYELDFEVTPDVLIPRPETELIVEAVLDLFPVDAEFSFADVGTGSGCIAISILHARPRSRAIAIDQSERALRTAQRNANRWAVTDRARLLKSDLFGELAPSDVFNLVVSNPPYVRDGELSALQREVQREPRTALAGGLEGLDVIRRLMKDTPGQLHAGGFLIFEFGINQDEAIRELVDDAVWELIEIRRDLQQIPRVIILRKK